MTKWPKQKPHSLNGLPPTCFILFLLYVYRNQQFPCSNPTLVHLIVNHNRLSMAIKWFNKWFNLENFATHAPLISVDHNRLPTFNLFCFRVSKKEIPMSIQFYYHFAPGPRKRGTCGIYIWSRSGNPSITSTSNMLLVNPTRSYWLEMPGLKVNQNMNKKSEPFDVGTETYWNYSKNWLWTIHSKVHRKKKQNIPSDAHFRCLHIISSTVDLVRYLYLIKSVHPLILGRPHYPWPWPFNRLGYHGNVIQERLQECFVRLCQLHGFC